MAVKDKPDCKYDQDVSARKIASKEDYDRVYEKIKVKFAEAFAELAK
jgi:hypothetical protein